jgi:hypothetical protein
VEREIHGAPENQSIVKPELQTPGPPRNPDTPQCAREHPSSQAGTLRCLGEEAIVTREDTGGEGDVAGGGGRDEGSVEGEESAICILF